jgi:hypothetical protein
VTRSSKDRFAFIGTPNSSKTAFLPYLTGEREVIPPIAEAMYKLGYISKTAYDLYIKRYEERRKQ